jgi:hypothetical protein
MMNLRFLQLKKKTQKPEEDNEPPNLSSSLQTKKKTKRGQ